MLNNLIMALTSSAIVILGIITTYITNILKQKSKSHNNLIINNKDQIKELQQSLILIEKKIEEIINNK